MIEKNNTNFDSAKQFVEFGLNEKKVGHRESASGPGSYINNTKEVSEFILQIVKKYNIKSLLDLGCGDWNWFSILIDQIRKEKGFEDFNYIGWDSHPKLIDELNKKYGNKNTTFQLKDIVTEEYPKVDLIICRDVLFHMKPSIITEVLDKIYSADSKYFLTTTYDIDKNHDEENIKKNNNIPNWYFHLINLDISPYDLSKDKLEQREEINCKHDKYNRFSVLYKIKEKREVMIENLFLSVGAMKAGTTWLYEQLKDHPEIYFTPEKEIHYFANKVGIENQLNHRNRILKFKPIMEKYAKGNPAFISQNMEEIYWYSNYARPKEIDNDWYQSLFSLNKDRKFNADFSNLYCQMDKDGWDNVRKIGKNIKVIYTLRDPLKRLWSHYKFHMKWVNREDEALEVGFEHFKELLDKHFFWINAEYTRNYKLLKENLKDDELMILYFEDFREDPVKMLLEVQRFLGVEEIEPTTENLEKKVNKTKEFELPEEWMEYMKIKLSDEMKQLKEIGIWHEKWKIS
ncbi:sulfotransferase domain-containing protein [Poseidonibacter lekithochrous]|uniref:sulfotransferase domain-containing protein n=1 Tax=Poseidonibacter TaxID=2321187 RepID=UPI001C095DFA|nr:MULTISPECIES: sulfotransferase domain-containing protein [Poseidonibacter]MBU3014061.1 sulfotransferase domain-containing protein [Poseidonibacter lekithochrous]MDO6827358.1 sulfotransferase domain-containing protein [Poseidonibacter sp. 1_MG-2023]